MIFFVPKRCRINCTDGNIEKSSVYEKLYGEFDYSKYAKLFIVGKENRGEKKIIVLSILLKYRKNLNYII